MIPHLLSGPTAEPISLAQARQWLKVDATEEDDLIGGLVTSARLIVESLTRRMLMTQSWRLILDAWPSGPVLDIPFAPVRSVSAVRVHDAAGVAQVLANDFYRLEASLYHARMVLSAIPPAPGRATGGVEIDVVLGYGDLPEDVPAPLRQAIRLLTARWFEERGDAMSQTDAQSLPAPVAALIAPWRRMRLA